MSDQAKIDTLRALLHLLLDQVDYTASNCSATDKVAAVLPVCVIKQCREGLAVTKK